MRCAIESAAVGLAAVNRSTLGGILTVDLAARFAQSAAESAGEIGMCDAAATPLASVSRPADCTPPAVQQPPAGVRFDTSGLPFAAPEALDAHVERSWEYWRRLGSPRWHVAPMVDQSELPFRMLCRAHGATAAYTPMLHARLFAESATYRREHFTTTDGDRPLFVQFCANDPDIFVTAARYVQEHADYVDLNLGCPQRIARRGKYGAFLMDDPKIAAAIVAAAARGLDVPVSVKIRLYPSLSDTIAYAQMLQAAGASLIAVHGRTRDMKDASAHPADWSAIAAVRAALRVPVLANGGVRCLADAQALLTASGAEGVLSAEPLLHDPVLFSSQRLPTAVSSPRERLALADAYLALAGQHPVHGRMVKGHLHKLLQDWLSEHILLREELNRSGGSTPAAALAQMRSVVERLTAAVEAAGRDEPQPVLCDRKRAAADREAARAAAIAEQQREEAALAALDSSMSQQQGQQGQQGQQQQLGDGELEEGAVTQAPEPDPKRHQTLQNSSCVLPTPVG